VVKDVARCLPQGREVPRSLGSRVGLSILPRDALAGGTAISFAFNRPVNLAEGVMFVGRTISRNFLDGLLRHIGGRWGNFCGRGLLVLLFAIWPLAEASPPDPLWVGGMYDGADLDDVVAAVMAATAVVARTVLLLLGPIVIVAIALLLADRSSLPRSSLPRPVRAPPSLMLCVAA